MSYSQLKQDINVLQYYNYKRNGTFIEIGANDGILLSNTYLLEKSYGWTGICVEAIPSIFESLKKNRTCLCINKAVFDESDKEVDFVVCEQNLLSGMTDYINDVYKGQASNGTKITVETVSLNDVIEQSDLPNHIDYLSIDTEGTELNILQALDFNKYTFGVIHVEHNYHKEKRGEIRKLLESNGYNFLRENKWDDEYTYKTFAPRFTRKFIWNR
jgi:FkbM family methyltransferase